MNQNRMFDYNVRDELLANSENKYIIIFFYCLGHWHPFA